jgi:MFS family permease
MTLLRALNSRNYRRYFAGQLVSLAGTWMQQIAMTWLAFRLTGSALILGVVGFASQLPILLFGSLGGVWSDRFDRRRLLLATQSLAMVQALALAVLTFEGRVSPALIVLLAFCLGCVNSFDVPARQAFVVQLVEDRADLPNAIALNSFLMNSARFVGPALAGFVVATAGEAVCFLLNALSYLAVLVALAGIRTPRQETKHAAALRALREGFAYVLNHRDIRGFLLVVAGISFLVTPYAVMMPLFAKEIFGGDARTYGLLIGSAGAGSLLGSLYLASHHHVDRRLARRVASASTAAGLALAGFSQAGYLWLAFPALMLMGFTVIFTIAGSNTLIQTWVEDDFRGRVMAIFAMAFLGIAPLGSLTVGSFAHAVGVRPTLLACGLLAAAVGFSHRRRL